MSIRLLALRIPTTVFVAGIVVAALGCGGGGGAGTTPTTSSPVYVGNTDPADITETNAASLVANVIGGHAAPRAYRAPNDAAERSVAPAATVPDPLFRFTWQYCRWQVDTMTMFSVNRVVEP